MAGLSSFGRLYRISRLNSLTFGLAFNLLGVDSAVKMGLRYGNFSVFKKGMILDQIRGHSRVGTWPTEDDLIPRRIIGRPVDAFLSNHALRGCLTCLKAGFHSLIHQARWIETCPWHLEALVDQCTCGRPLFGCPESPKSFILVCKCGRDFFDRLTSLSTLSAWPERAIKRTIRDEVRRAQDRRTLDDLHVERGVPLNIALAASFKKDGSSPYWMCTEVTHDGMDNFENDEQIRKIIVCWDEIIFPSYDISVPLLTREINNINAFALTVISRLRQSKGRYSCSRPFIAHNGDVRFCTTPIETIDSVSSIYLSDENLAFGRELISQFVSKHCSCDTRITDRRRWMYSRDKSLEHPNDELKLLARILSVLASHCVIEDLTKRAWASYACRVDYFRSPIRVRCSGKAMLLRRRDEVSKAFLFRSLPLPEFKDPTPAQRENFLRSSGRYVDPAWPFLSNAI
jgi:hypothetical protein